MSDLKKGWIEVPFSTLLISLESGSRPKGGVRGINEGIPSVGGEHLKYDGTFDFTSIKYVPKAFAIRMSKGRISENDILIVKDGATTGKVSFVNSEFPFKEAVVNEHVFICRPSKELNPRFIFRYLMSKEGNERILDNFQGSAQGGINHSFAPNTFVPLAPLAEQHLIVAKLENLLTKVEASKKRLDKFPKRLKRFRQSVLAAACSGKLTEDWREGNINVQDVYIDLLEFENKRITEFKSKNNYKTFKFEDSIFSSEELPTTWKIAKIGYLCDCIVPGRDKPKTFSGTIPWITLPDIKSDFIDGISCTNNLSNKEIAEVNARIIPSNSVIISCIGRFGISFINTREIVINQQLHAYLQSSIILSKYLMYYMKTMTEYMQEVSTATTVAYLNKDNCNSIPINLPPLKEQQEIVRRVEALFAIADQLEARYKKAQAYVEKLTQSILAKAFRGELVPQDPNDESASVLLERINAEKENNITVQKKTQRIKRRAHKR